MKIKFLGIIVGLILSSACTPAMPSPSPTASPVALTPTPVNSDFDAARAYAYNRMLAVTIGARVAGTDTGAQAGDYIAQQFARNGLTIEKQAFPFSGWEDHGTQVQMTAPENRILDARAIQYSPAGKIEAELVAVGGLGNESDFGKVDVKGKIALVQRGTLPFSDKAANAQKAGAVATIVYNNAPENFQGTLRDPGAIPVIAMSGRDGQAIIDLMAQGAVKIKIDSDTANVQRTGRNILGTQRGTNDSIIVLGGHCDSVEVGKGANDNGSGMAVLLELVRVLSQKQTKHTLVFVAFDAEELGLIGSRHYVAGLPDDTRKKIVAMLNFDMLAGGDGPLLLGGDGKVGKVARDAATTLNIEARNFRLGNNAGSDHQPFQAIGIDTVFFSRDYNLLHTPQDTFDQVHQDWLGEAGRVAVKVVEELER